MRLSDQGHLRPRTSWRIESVSCVKGLLFVSVFANMCLSVFSHMFLILVPQKQLIKDTEGGHENLF